MTGDPQAETREVVFVDHAAALGGAELYLLDVVRNYPDPCRVVLFEDGPLIKELTASGIRVDVVEAPELVSSVRKRASWLTGVLAAPQLLGFAWRLRKLLRGARAVLLNSQKALVAGAPAARLERLPVIWNLHDIMTADHFGSANRRIALAVANRFVTRVIANSHATSDALLKSGYKGGAIDIVYNGIEASAFAQGGESDRAELRVELGIDPADKVVGLFGRLSEWKGQHVLIEALKALPNVKALLVGAALFDGDRVYEESLRKQIQDAALSHRVVRTGFRKDIPALMGICDAIAHTSTAPEPFGRVIVEAMLAKVPVVASRAGGAREIVVHEQNGLLFEPGNPEDLARCLSMVLVRDRRVEGIVARARLDAVNRFSIEKMVAGVYDSVALALPSSSSS